MKKYLLLILFLFLTYTNVYASSYATCVYNTSEGYKITYTLDNSCNSTLTANSNNPSHIRFLNSYDSSYQFVKSYDDVHHVYKAKCPSKIYYGISSNSNGIDLYQISVSSSTIKDYTVKEASLDTSLSTSVIQNPEKCFSSENYQYNSGTGRSYETSSGHVYSCTTSTVNNYKSSNGLTGDVACTYQSYGPSSSQKQHIVITKKEDSLYGTSYFFYVVQDGNSSNKYSLRLCSRQKDENGVEGSHFITPDKYMNDDNAFTYYWNGNQLSETIGAGAETGSLSLLYNNTCPTFGGTFTGSDGLNKLSFYDQFVSPNDDSTKMQCVDEPCANGKTANLGRFVDSSAGFEDMPEAFTTITNLTTIHEDPNYDNTHQVTNNQYVGDQYSTEKNFCRMTGVLGTLEAVHTLINISKILLPIILIILGTIELSKSVVSGDESTIKKSTTKLIVKCIVAIVIFLIPTIVNAVIKLYDNDKDTSSFHNCAVCFSESRSECDSIIESLKG